MSADAPILYDWSGAPVASANAPITSRPGQALNTTAQGGMVALGADANNVARVPRVDQYGTLSVQNANPAGTAAMVYTGQTPPATTSQYGNLMLGRQDTPASAYQPVTFDMNGNVYVHVRGKVTARGIIRQIATAQNKYLASLVNSSSSSVVVRLYEVNIYCTPGGVSGSLLGSSQSTYYPLICEIYRVNASAVSGGSSVTPTMCDSADTLASGISFLSAPTVSSYVSSIYRGDAYLACICQSNFYARRDMNEKSLVIRPGEGMALICLSSGVLAAAGGGTTSNSPVDVQFVFTTAPA